MVRSFYKRGYGMADLDHDVPITSETIFHVASISKQFTAAAILLLAQDGKLSLDDEVHKYINELPDFGSPITVRHLIHHTSGLRDQWALLGLAGWRYSLDLITDDDVMELMTHQKELNFKPGEKHVYCNTGYTLLAHIVKRVSGQSFREFTTIRIFEPLGMRSTHFRDDHAEIVKHIAYGYEQGKGRNVYRLSVTNFDTVGATSLLTTVEDLAHWDENFYHPRVGGAALVAQQSQRGKLNSGKDLDYAFGLAHGMYRGLATFDDGGADAGYRADLLRFPQQHFSVACLCNQAETNPGELARKVADIYLADQFKSRRRRVLSLRPSPSPSQTNDWLSMQAYIGEKMTSAPYVSCTKTETVFVGVRGRALGIVSASRQSFSAGRFPRGVYVRSGRGWCALAREYSGAGTRKGGRVRASHRVPAHSGAVAGIPRFLCERRNRAGLPNRR